MKSFIKYTVIIAFLFSMLSFPSNAQNKDEVFTKLKSTFSNLSSLSVDFTSVQDSKIKGNIKAKRGNKYVLKASDRIIFCNGKTIWNFDINENKVIVSDYEEMPEETASIENFFFAFIDSFQPDRLYKEQSSTRGGSGLVLVLKPLGNAEKFKNIREIKLWLNSSNNNIESLEIIEPNSVNAWILKNLVLNRNFPDSQFDFIIPKEATVIDLR